jgi:hypothetical protein
MQSSRLKPSLLRRFALHANPRPPRSKGLDVRILAPAGYNGNSGALFGFGQMQIDLLQSQASLAAVVVFGLLRQGGEGDGLPFEEFRACQSALPNNASASQHTSWCSAIKTSHCVHNSLTGAPPRIASPPKPASSDGGVSRRVLAVALAIGCRQTRCDGRSESRRDSSRYQPAPGAAPPDDSAGNNSARTDAIHPSAPCAGF